uniref:uncharacterized protein LOC122598064 n=1 Tax=Erigeron canadensis TaxID=72917 RepID=UPI001CB96F19|nr:uncharacterized protein LOC122598064 [Erigeron canadensis]
MAAAEARAVWQRTANRYIIQEDAKRAPKLACCPSSSSLISKVDTKQDITTYVYDGFLLQDDKSFYSNLSGESIWWLQSQPDYIHQRGLSLTGEQVSALEGPESHQFVENQDVCSINSGSKESYEFVDMGSVEIPWLQKAEKDHFDPLFPIKSHDFIKNCDLSKPMQKGLISKQQKIKCCQNGISQVQVQRVESKPVSEIDSSKSMILKALCHSQTRAREAENAAKQAYAEKEHVIKLLFRQASQLFAYRQWVYLLQLENLCYQMKSKTSNPMPSKSGKLHKNLKKAAPSKRKRSLTRRGFGLYEHDIRKYAVVFVMGLGIVSAGLLLGWTVGWMLI